MVDYQLSADELMQPYIQSTITPYVSYHLWLVTEVY